VQADKDIFIDPDKVGVYNSYMSIDTSEIVRNYSRFQEYIGSDIGIIPVIKGNCYGYGSARIAKLIIDHFHVDLMACASVSEAVALRENGIDTDIMLIAGAPIHTLRYVVEYDLQIPIYDSTTLINLEKLSAASNKISKIHIKINTGMNRLGVRPGDELSGLLDALKTVKNVEVVGVYTHFATATCD